MDTTPDSSKPSGRRFPVFLADQRSIWPGLPDSIPWEVIALHERQANLNHGHSLETIARRGGLSPYDVPCQHMLDRMGRLRERGF